MSLAGIHVECGLVAGRGNSMLFDVIWSETVAYGVSTTQSAPQNMTNPGGLVFRVRNSAVGDAFVSRGGGKAHFLAGEMRDLPAKPGEVVNALAA